MGSREMRGSLVAELAGWRSRAVRLVARRGPGGLALRLRQHETLDTRSEPPRASPAQNWNSVSCTLLVCSGNPCPMHADCVYTFVPGGSAPKPTG